MKKAYEFMTGLVLLAVLSGCQLVIGSDGGNNSPETPETPESTSIQFSNPGAFQVTVYTNPNRQDDFKAVVVEPRGTSSISWGA